MLFSPSPAIAKHLAYSSCSECLFALHDVQAIDYYFANNALLKRYEIASEDVFFEDAEAISQVFHVLIGLSYFLRQGHSCLAVNAIGAKTYWSDIEQRQETMSADKQTTNTKLGFTFASESQLQEIIQRFYAISPSRKDIEWLAPNLYTGRYASYENAVAAFFKSQQTQHIQLGDTQCITLKSCIDELWPNLFSTLSTQVIPWQQISVANGLIAQTSIISGGAGTGKTYTVARLLLSWLYTQNKDFPQNTRLLLAAPTGKAAQRLNESILTEFDKLLDNNQQNQVSSLIADLRPMIEAKTIHRLLGLGMHGIEPRYNDKKQLDCDFLVIDEASMIDLAMMAKLLRALPKTAKLVLLGDANQLPSVESGGLLKDLVNQSAWQDGTASDDFSRLYTQSHQHLLAHLLPHVVLSKESSKLPDSIQGSYQYNHVTFLQKSMRSDNEITRLAESILNGKAKEFASFISPFKSQKSADKTGTAQQLSLLEVTDETEVITWHDDAYTQNGILKPSMIETIAQRYECVFECDQVDEAISKLQQYRLLSGTKKGRLGTEFLNAQIEQQLRKSFAHIDAGQVYHGMPIMIVQNDYRLKLFNGDIGVIWTSAEGKLEAFFSDADAPSKANSFSVNSLPAFELVYAMTIHKTQGSEFKHVDIVLPNSIMQGGVSNSAQHLSRELLYTGVTRAKSSVGLIANLGVLKNCIENTSTRFSGLKQSLINAKHGL